MTAAFIGSGNSADPVGAADPPPRLEVLGPPTTKDERKLVAELAELRTRTSRTYVDELGLRTARLFPGSVNYRADDGSWRLIDNELVPEAGGYRNRANGWSVRLPSQLAGEAVRLQKDNAWIAFSLREASGQVEAQGTRATYRDARPGVDAVYTVESDAVKEDLVLKRPDSVRDFRFDLELSPGLSPRRAARALKIDDADGRPRFDLAAPVMVDAAGQVSHAIEAKLTREEGRWAVQLSPTDGWLDDPKRSWPVHLDPPTSPNPTRDCTISQDSGSLYPATTSQSCTSTTLSVGGRSYTKGNPPDDRTTRHNSLLHFDVQAAVPPDSDILASTMGVVLRNRLTTSPLAVSVRPVQKPWTTAVTWDQYDTGSAWSTGGGDYGAEAATATMGGSDFTPNTLYRFNLRELTRDWQSGATANYGVGLTAGTANELTFASTEDAAARPYLEIQYTARTGERRGYRFEVFQLSDRIALKVNVANGNLLLRQTDLDIPGGLGPGLSVARSYNSMNTPTIYGDFRNDYGDGWDIDTGQDVRLLYRTNDDTYFFGPSGYVVRFIRSSAGGDSYIEPTGFDVRLTKDAGSDPQPHSLTELRSQLNWRFDSAGKLIRMTDRNGRRITFDYATGDPNLVDRIIDPRGRQTSFTYDAGNRIATMVDPAGRTYGYDRLGGSTLRTYTDPAGKTTSYEYDGIRLTKVTTPADRVTQIAYYPTGHALAGRVQSVTRVTPSTTDVDPKTSFTYTINQDGSATGKVTDPIGNETTSNPNDRITTYEFNPYSRLTKITDALGRKQEMQEHLPSALVEKYWSPDNDSVGGTGPTTTTFKFSSTSNITGTETRTGTSDDAVKTITSYGPRKADGTLVTGGSYLPVRTSSAEETATDSSGETGTGYRYDDLGNLTMIKKDPGTVAEVAFTYKDAAAAVDGKPGQLWKITDPRGNATELDFDSEGNLQKLTPPLDATAHPALTPTELRYDELPDDNLEMSRPSSISDGSGRLSFAYDNLDRVTEQTFYNTASTEQLQVNYTYDADGYLTKRTDSVNNGTLAIYDFVTDALGRLTSEVRPGPDNSYTYDAVGNLKTLTDAGGTVSYTYDSLNRQASATPPGSPLIDLNFNDDTTDGGRSATIKLPGTTSATNLTLVTRFDRAERLTSIKATKGVGTTAEEVVHHFSYRYAHPSTGLPKRLRTSAIDERTSDVTEYRYDPLQRLDLAWRRDTGQSTHLEDWNYDYDSAGNLTRRQHDSSVTTYAHDNNNRLCWRHTAGATGSCASPPAGAGQFGFDKAGNETTGIGGRISAYNAAKQMTSHTPAGQSSLAMTYAGAGQAERLTSGSLNIGHNLLGIGSVTGGTSPSYYTRADDGQLLSERPTTNQSAARYYLPDAIGSTRTVIDRDGTILRRLDYDPYGIELASSSGSGFARFRFAGGMIDNSGLLQFGQRYYDPIIGRWTQPDPLNQAGDLRQANRYAYVGGDPINYFDPFGLHGCPATIESNIANCEGTGAGGFSSAYRTARNVYGGASSFSSDTYKVGKRVYQGAPAPVKRCVVGLAIGAYATKNPYGAVAGCAVFAVIGSR